MSGSIPILHRPSKFQTCRVKSRGIDTRAQGHMFQEGVTFGWGLEALACIDVQLCILFHTLSKINSLNIYRKCSEKHTQPYIYTFLAAGNSRKYGWLCAGEA